MFIVSNNTIERTNEQMNLLKHFLNHIVEYFFVFIMVSAISIAVHHDNKAIEERLKAEKEAEARKTYTTLNADTTPVKAEITTLNVNYKTTIVTVDSCEYFYYNGNLSHKGNCTNPIHIYNKIQPILEKPEKE